MKQNTLDNGAIQYVAEIKELKKYLNICVRDILREELPTLLQDLSKKEWLTKNDLIELTGWSSRTIQHMRDTNKIPFTKDGRKILFPRNGIMEFLEENLVKSNKDV